MLSKQKRIVRNALDREYQRDLIKRKLKVSCPRCRAARGNPCIHDQGPRRGQPMAGVHRDRSDLANRVGLVKGPHFWGGQRYKRRTR